MSDLDEKINKAKEIYNMIVFLERGINNDYNNYNEIKLIENYNSIIGTIKIYYELLETFVGPNISLSTEILDYYNESKQKLTEIETKMNRLSENELLDNRGVTLHDNNKEQTQKIIPGTIDPITHEDITNRQTIAYLIDDSNKQYMDKENKKFPPPAFIYDEKKMRELENLYYQVKVPIIHLHVKKFKKYIYIRLKFQI
uniref:Uncharacterized protein n=1 Tax=viral metagenome TaxID=1070528 RepID=A0A6C0KRG0_9ZZZZ